MRPVLSFCLLSCLCLVTSAGLSGCTQPQTTPVYAGPQTPAGLAPRFLTPDGWAWGFVSVPGQASLRYGVAAPTGAPKATVILLSGPGETAELYFETARDLAARGCVVWVLDAAGTPDKAADAAVAAVRTLARPGPDDPIVLGGGGALGVSLVKAAASLSDLRLAVAVWGDAARTSAPPAQDGDLHGRDRLADLWFTANPALRRPERQVSWRLALAQSQAASQAGVPVEPARPTAPVLLLNAPSGVSCLHLESCRTVALPAAAALPFAGDNARHAWLSQLMDLADGLGKRAPHGQVPIFSTET